MKIRLFTIPNMLTLSNLLCGTFALVSALKYGNLEWSFWFVVLAAVFDFFDGFVARLLGQSSPIGLQLDSLADVVSFGAVPAAVLYVMTTRSFTEEQTLLLYVYAFASFLLAAFSALRLAKFNIDETQHEEFCGLPTPANALFFMAWLLVSPVRMFALKFRGFGWRGNQVRYLFLLLAVALIAILRLYAVPAIILAYILISAIRWGMMCRATGCGKG